MFARLHRVGLLVDTGDVKEADASRGADCTDFAGRLPAAQATLGDSESSGGFRDLDEALHFMFYLQNL